MGNAKIVMVTGISGSGRKEFCSKYEAGRENVKVYHTGEMIFKLAQGSLIDPPLSKENILNFPPMRLRDLRKMAFDSILNEDKSAYEKVLINTHAQFFWKHVYTNAYDWVYLNQIPTNMFLTIIDKPSNIKAKQIRTEQWRSQNLDAEDLLLWQNIEVNVTQGWASNYGKPMYVLPSKQNPEIIDSLLENYFLIYFGMPMTFASQEANERISEFKEKLLALGEKINGKPTPIIDPRYIDIEKDLEGKMKETADMQTVHRDLHWYIPEATHIVDYYPPGTEISQGVSDEWGRAYDTGKYIFVVFHRENKSPFAGKSHGIFRNEEEFFKFFPEHMEKKIKELKRK